MSKVTITVSGPTGSGKSRIIRAIELGLKHAGLTAEIVEKQTHRSEDATSPYASLEHNITDFTEWMELERNVGYTSGNHGQQRRASFGLKLVDIIKNTLERRHLLSKIGL